ncbi:MAG: gliding motility protein GldL [Bacteroidales bacterium]|nr:gliding motility protein GldL [Bacteroidales bacterium]MBN2748071.1 gliding motility protein GldL [Bacteroidales bacterium]
MKYLYGWGAAAVIVGALFKLMHWPGAGIMLTIGMTVEAVIFFFSAFEPIHEEVDWTLVYPELAGMSDEEELKQYRSSGRNSGLDAETLKEVLGSVLAANSQGASAGGASVVAPSAQPVAVQPQAVHHATVSSGGASGALIFTEKFNKMLENAEIGPDLFEKVSRGLSKLGDTSAKLADISNAAAASNEFSDKMRKASDAVSGLSDSYSKSGQVLSESVNILSESYQKVASVIGESGSTFASGIKSSVSSLEQQLSSAGDAVKGKIVESGSQVAGQLSNAAQGFVTTYQQLAEAMKANGEILNDGSQNYHEQLNKLNKNMSALNAAHELHLSVTSDKLKQSEEVYAGVEKMMKTLKGSMSETEMYAQSVSQLNQNIAALNAVYGNMLSAMNVISNGK